MPERKPLPEREKRLVRQVRLAATVMTGTITLWMGAQYLGAQRGWSPRLAILFDLAAIAALVWALVVTYWVWKERQQN